MTRPYEILEQLQIEIAYLALRIGSLAPHVFSSEPRTLSPADAELVDELRSAMAAHERAAEVIGHGYERACREDDAARYHADRLARCLEPPSEEGRAAWLDATRRSA